MLDDFKNDAKSRMQKCIVSFQGDLKKLRTGRAHPSLIEHIKVDFYGSESPLNQVANISVEDARTLSITPWDRNMVAAIEKAIHKSDLHLTPMTAGAVIRIPLPPLTEERRKDIMKVVRQDAENARVSVRNVRRDVLAEVKEALKEKLITQDEERKAQDEIQKLTDKAIADIDGHMAAKEKGNPDGLSATRSAAACNALMSLPRHVAIIMDGNGRWAAARGLPRHAGHKEGVEPVRMCVRECLRNGIGALTLFAFSSENWGRPGEEVAALMGLFMEALDGELDELNQNGVRLVFIGDRQGFPPRLQTRMAAAEQRTAGNSRLRLQVAVGYGGPLGHRECRPAARAAQRQRRAASRRTSQRMTWPGCCSWPGFRIRTCSSAPVANAASAISCCGTWPTRSCISARSCGPNSTAEGFNAALADFASRQRRYGLTGEQAAEDA